ncbi:redoxin domain-containing protein [Dawidia soli]|uniref:Redoxin domain-containing protein n=1 Tax=Dawidia soli TaxID=2782352 RepID=A0AAP2GFM4_9BACT|nr:redoxin domain-containing protein [Dawidia soli]MBT1689614.1 redoxin domain-containing protein [Dawidia soli]
MRRILLAFLLIVSTMLLTGQSGNAKPQKAVRPIPADSLIIWVFLALDCPISQKYISELTQIDSVYRMQGVQVKAVIPGSVSQAEIDNFWKEYGIRFSAVADPDFQWVRRFSARITPEVFLTDINQQVIYRGAIDDWFFDLGKYRQRVTQRYLRDAIEAVQRHKVPGIRETEAVGCPIQVLPSAKAKK